MNPGSIARLKALAGVHEPAEPARTEPHYPIQQGQSLMVWFLYEYTPHGRTWLEAVFTHKVQAEAALRSYMKAGGSWYLVERRTEPHDNHC